MGGAFIVEVQAGTDFGVVVTVDDNRFREEAWSKPIVLVVDKMCHSSCESMIEVLGDLPNTIIIGTHSGGTLRFGNVGATALPNSKILVCSGWTSFDYLGGVPEGLGYEPTYCATGENLTKAATQFLLNSGL